MRINQVRDFSLEAKVEKLSEVIYVFATMKGIHKHWHLITFHSNKILNIFHKELILNLFQ